MKTKLFFVFLFAIAISLSAQDRGRGDRNMDPAERAKRQKENLEKRFKELKETLKLDAGQEKKIKDIWEARSKERQKMFEGMGGRGQQGGAFDPAAMQNMRSKMEAAEKATNDKIKAVLKGDQVKKYEEYVKEQASKMGQGMGRGRGDRNNGDNAAAGRTGAANNDAKSTTATRGRGRGR